MDKRISVETPGNMHGATAYYFLEKLLESGKGPGMEGYVDFRLCGLTKRSVELECSDEDCPDVERFTKGYLVQKVEDIRKIAFLL